MGARCNQQPIVVQALAAIELDAAAKDGIPKGVAMVAANQPDVAINALPDASSPITDIQVESA